MVLEPLDELLAGGLDAVVLEDPVDHLALDRVGEHSLGEVLRDVLVVGEVVRAEAALGLLEEPARLLLLDASLDFAQLGPGALVELLLVEESQQVLQLVGPQLCDLVCAQLRDLASGWFRQSCCFFLFRRLVVVGAVNLSAELAWQENLGCRLDQRGGQQQVAGAGVIRSLLKHVAFDPEVYLLNSKSSQFTI